MPENIKNPEIYQSEKNWKSNFHLLSSKNNTFLR